MSGCGYQHGTFASTFLLCCIGFHVRTGRGRVEFGENKPPSRHFLLVATQNSPATLCKNVSCNRMTWIKKFVCYFIPASMGCGSLTEMYALINFLLLLMMESVRLSAAWINVDLWLFHLLFSISMTLEGQVLIVEIFLLFIARGVSPQYDENGILIKSRVIRWER